MRLPRSTSPADVAVRMMPAVLVLGVLSIEIPRLVATWGTVATLPLDIAASATLIIAGLAVLLSGRPRWGGLAALVAGGVWLAPEQLSGGGQTPELRTAGLLSAPVVVPVLFLVALAVLGPRRGGTRPIGAFAVTLVGTALILGAIRVTTDQPLTDPDCVDPCRVVPPFLPLGATGRTAIRALGWTPGLLAALGMAAHGVLAFARQREPGRRLVAVVVVVAGVAGTSQALAGIRRTVAEDGPSPALAGVAWLVPLALGGGAIVLAGSLIVTVVARWVRTARLRRALEAFEAAPQPGAFGQAVTDAFGAPGIEVAYRTDTGGFVDAAGRPVDIDADDAGGAAVIRDRDGRPLAVVRGVDPDVELLAAAVRPSALVALDNERLRAATLARLRELQASRSRIVATADATRARIERDLHDGAQQRLLSIALDLRVARATAEHDGDEQRVARLGAAEGVAAAVIDELRRVAQGIHPAVLSQAGLGPAIASLADEAPIPVQLDGEVGERLPSSIEVAAYRVVERALIDAVTRGAGDVRVRLGRAGDDLVVETVDDGTAIRAIPAEIADRVGAAGGSIAITDGGLRAALPCA